MATGSPFMGTLKGKLGETVALRRNGKQVLRAYVRDIKNPNSQKQQVQRMVQATAAQAYSAMKKICDHSFEGVQVGQKSMSYFISKNMDKLRAAITAGVDGSLVSSTADYVRKGVNLPVLNEYVVAKGTLPEVALYDESYTGNVDIDPHILMLVHKSTEALTLSSVHNFVSANSGQVGDWFTFLFLLRQNGAEQNGQQIYRFAFIRFVVEEQTSGQDVKLTLLPSITNFGPTSIEFTDVWSTVEDDNENPFALGMQIENLFPNIGDAEGNFSPVAYAVIHSRQNVGGAWQRSNAEMVIRSNWSDLDITFPGDFFAELATYAGSAEAKGLGDYVLNGGD